MAQPTIHASAVLTGRLAVLIRGPSGSGKSALALGLIDAAACGAIAFARLVGDDRVHVEATNGRLIVRPPSALAGQIEIRGLGVRRIDFEPMASVGLIVDLAAPDAARMPGPDSLEARISGIVLPRLPVASGADALLLTLGWLRGRSERGR
jgi:serine kinase of HPr protein (carbohydrate metabolism regulator)